MVVEVRLVRNKLYGKNGFKIESDVRLDAPRSRSRREGFVVWGDVVWVPSPKFTVEEKRIKWYKNHLPKRKLERFLTASLKRGRVRIASIEI